MVSIFWMVKLQLRNIIKTMSCGRVKKLEIIIRTKISDTENRESIPKTQRNQMLVLWRGQYSEKTAARLTKPRRKTMQKLTLEVKRGNHYMYYRH